MATPRVTHTDPAPAALYTGRVMHARLRPRAHRFSYRVMNLLIDLDRLTEAGRLSWLFGVNRAGLVSFQERDHGEGEGPLRAFADRLLRQHGIARPERVLLSCYPRMLGYVFNPLSVYYCYDGGRLSALIYEVRNTFGGVRHYVGPVRPEENVPAGIRQTQRKDFYVSPFIGMDARYHFRLEPPGETLKLRILETDGQGPLLAAAFVGRRRPLSSPVLLGALISLPLMTLKVIGAIHFEALRLWLKGVALVPRPQAADPQDGTMERRLGH